MNSEFAVLKKFWENGRRSYVKLISDQTGLGLDYARYLCNCLVKKNQLNLIKGKRDCYEITTKGKKKLTLLGIIKEKIPKKVSKLGKVLSYLPSKKLRVNLPHSDSEIVIVKSSKTPLITAEEKKLNLGEKIEKAVSFLIHANEN